MKRILGFLVAVLALTGGGLGSRGIDAARTKEARRDVSAAAESAAHVAMETLSGQVSDLKDKAENASANPRLVFALHGNVDESTMRDLWRTEEWWRPWRTEFKIYGIAIVGMNLDVVEGIDAADLDAEALIKRVREQGNAASEIIVGKGWPYAAAATAVGVPGRDPAPVLLLAKPLDQTVLRRLAEKAGAAVILTDGRTSLMEAGPQKQRTFLSQAIGSESGGQVFLPPDGMWAAASSAVAPGLWIWTFASRASATHESELVATERKVILWIVAGLVASIALVVALRLGPSVIATGSGEMSLPIGGQTPASGSSPALSDVPTTTTGRARSRGVPALAAEGTTLTVPAPFSGAIPAEAPFGRYTLLDRLGEGGMAEVYTAVTFGAEGFRRKFVIKRLRAELVREPVAVDQFIDEANLASSMVHSNIVPVFDFGKVGDEYFMALEYILGRDLARVTRRSMERDGRALPAPAVLYLAQETLKALEYAHTKTSEVGTPLGIVHRDVSPMNVIVSARGEVKLFDFGIVKAEGRVTKTQVGVVKGNVTFMSPEQARGTNVDARADLFSMGLLMYYCLTGDVLYQGNTTYELLVKAATGPGPEELDKLRALPDACGAIMLRALQANPADRFQTAREFGEAVAAGTAGGAAELLALMQHLFTEDFNAEEARFGSFNPGPSGPGLTGTGETVLRRT